MELHRGAVLSRDTSREAEQLQVRARRSLSALEGAAEPDRFLYVHSPEDILLQKLHWYPAGNEVSERQWRDVLAIVLVQGPRLDPAYLATMAARVGLTDLLQRAYREAERQAEG